MCRIQTWVSGPLAQASLLWASQPTALRVALTSAVSSLGELTAPLGPVASSSHLKGLFSLGHKSSPPVAPQDFQAEITFASSHRQLHTPTSLSAPLARRIPAFLTSR